MATPEERARMEEEARLHVQAAQDLEATQYARGFVGCVVYPMLVCVFAIIAIVFPMRSGRPMATSTFPKMLQYHEVAAVPHGFRSSFRDWAAEETHHPREIIEAVLAYVVQNKVEAAPADWSSPGRGCVLRTRRCDLDEPLGDDCDGKHLICCREDVKLGVLP